MKKSNDLFELVNSMSKSEKKYFHHYTSNNAKGQKSDYQILFESISKQKEYDELKLKAVLAKNGCKNEYRHVKHYLYQQLLRALQGYHYNGSKYEEVTNLLNNIKILHRKGLYNQCKKLISKGRKIARNHEFFGLLIDLHNWEIRLMYNTSNFDNCIELFDEIHQYSNNLSNTREYQEKVAEIFMFHLMDFELKSESREHQLDKIISKTPISIEKAKTYTAKENYYRLFSIYHGMKGDIKESLELREGIVELMENHEYLIKEEKTNYILACMNLTTGLYRENLFERLNKRIQIVKNQLERVKSDSIKSEIAAQCLAIQLRICMRTGEYSIAENILQDLENPEYRKSTYKLKLHYQFITAAYACFCLGKYSESLKWSNYILSQGLKQVGPGNYTVTSMINLITHLELGNQEQLVYYVKSTYRTLKNINQLNRLELAIIQFLKKLAKVDSNKELIENYTELQNQIIDSLKTQYERIRFENYFYISWLDNKISNTPIQEALLQRGKEIYEEGLYA